MVKSEQSFSDRQTDTVKPALLESTLITIMRVWGPLSPTCNGVGCRWYLPQPLHLLLHQLVVFLQATALMAHLSIPQLPQVEGIIKLHTTSPPQQQAKNDHLAQSTEQPSGRAFYHI